MCATPIIPAGQPARKARSSAAAALDQLSRYSPRATMTADPPTRTRSTWPAGPSARAYSHDGLPISSPCLISISSPKPIRPCRARWTASGPAAEPVAGSSGTPWYGANIRVFQDRPRPAKVFT